VWFLKLEMLHELNGLIQISHSVENYLLPLQIILVPHHTYPGLLWHGKPCVAACEIYPFWYYNIVGQILTLWPLPSGILIIRCGAKNAGCCVKVMAFNDLPYADLI